MTNGYRDLEVWQKSMDLCELIYELTKDFPADERFGLVSQLRRASVSVVSNIAEGAGRNSPKEFIQFLSISYGSLCEVEAQLLLSVRLDFAKESDIDAIMNMLSSVGRMTKALQRSLSTQQPRNQAA